MKSKDFYWPGFVGILTSMFVIMLVLFCLSFKVFSGKTKEITDQNKKLNSIEREYSSIKRVNSKIQSFCSDTTFEYLASCNKFIIRSLKAKNIFVRNEADLQDVYLKEMITAGHSLESFLQKSYRDDPNFFFMVILEGYMGDNFDNNVQKDSDLAFQTSYQRVLGIYQLWKKAGIVFQKHNVEFLISGRGFDETWWNSYDGKANYFSIQIIAKENKLLNSESIDYEDSH